MEKYYQNSQEHIFDELLLIDLIIYAQVIRFRSIKNDQNTLKGLYITEAEIDYLLQEDPRYDKWVDELPYVNDEYEKIVHSIENLNKKIKEKIKLTVKQGIELKLLQLAAIFNLDSFESNVLLICLAPEFDSKYRTLFAYLQDDVTRKEPSVELVLNMLCPAFREKNNARKYFSMQKALFKNGILKFINTVSDPDKPDIARGLKINRRIVAFLLDDDTIEDELSFFSRYYKSADTLDTVILPADIKEKLGQFIDYYNTAAEHANFIFAFYGAYGTQQLETAGALCNGIGTSLIVVDMPALYNSGILFEYAVDLILRECRMNFAAVFLKNCDFLFETAYENSYLKRYLIDEFDKYSLLTFLGSTRQLPIHGEFVRQKLICLELPVPKYEQRKLLWNNYLETQLLHPDVNTGELAGKYNLTGGQIQEVVATAGVYALWRNPRNPLVCAKDIEEACHIHSNQRLASLAQRIKPQHGWNDLVLKSEIKDKLRQIEKMFRHKHIVYNEWGFSRKLSLGKGISALFYGESGTGKTLAGEIIAHELGMDLYKIDIATVISKYIGETEKNLARIFDEAESSNAVLFFDEADAIFGKRTEVQDSHDRYSNIEVSYLLQRIDEYNGVVIMATNFNKNIDEAFERRLHFSIQFPMPDEDSRLQIWKNIFPAETPLAADIDFSLLAGQVELSGGHIKNIALQAAFFAADAPGEKIITRQIISAACENEFIKIGRLIRKGGNYGQ